MKNLTILIWIVLPISLLGQLHVEGTTLNETVIYAENTYDGDDRVTVISGNATKGTGSKTAVRGRAVGSGTLYGVYGYVTGGFSSEDVYGVYGFADNGNKDKYGLYGKAVHTSGTKYGIYATAGGSGTTYAGYFNGDVTVTGTFDNPSDIRLKRNIISLDNGILDKIIRLNPVYYEFKTEEYPFIQLPNGVHSGFIAQEIELEFPDLVSLEKQPDSDQNPFIFKGVNYIELIPLLTKAIQEQQVLIEDLQDQIELLKECVNINPPN